MYEVDAKHNKNISDVVACNLTMLESFILSTLVQLKGEDVNELVDLLHLTYLTISQQRAVEKRVVEVVKRLKNCAQLVQPEIHSLNMKNRPALIAEAAMMHKRKDLDMFVGSVLYRTW